MALIVASDGPLAKLVRRTSELAVYEKYRRRTLRAIGLGIHRGLAPRAFHAYTCLTGAWVRDQAIERGIAEKGAWIAPDQPLPGRNDPCVCGSGRKFKKCCMGKVSY